jgi:glycosyltransferase involved in cell wall biosynthesis
MRKPDLSIVVVTYQIKRQASRTLRSLARDYQRGLAGIDYDVLVVDNGSPDPLPESALADLDGNFRLHRLDPAPSSPAYAANLGVSLTQGQRVCVILDGARMVTPGLIARGVQATQLHRRPIVTTMAWHLGPEHQSLSVPKGYGPEAEEALLARIGWPADGYRLFEISALAAANPGGFFGSVNESCCLLLPRALWDEVGGFDERFDVAGGGLVSLDLFARLVALPDSQLVVLLGEGSFHQVHDRAATGPSADPAAWHAQYEALRGGPYLHPQIQPVYYGALPRPAHRWLTPA